MIRFVIARGLDLAERSHGILGNLIIITSYRIMTLTHACILIAITP